ncbi:glycosyltransferase [Nonlabens marinus]|uniref:Glycosyltransferase n=1 Tax=Nonlabens marinus S1-08 TaxID=1454201 RepID=W8W085_9FLAO|nr:glycosyltransferase [Nonlabens marinus]BAO55886.1 glycosyltransferase [Nonlabens marinus S1-08]
MEELQFSFIVPVFNRPVEVEQLLESLSRVRSASSFEVVIIEDGSSETCEQVCSRFRESVNISYFYKKNTGPGDSRNYGMQNAQGNYFIILDSDCLVPVHYLEVVKEQLRLHYVDCYGGPDAANDRFSDLQKAINYSMTSILTTGGIRGGSEALGKFQPRSFNMGLSKKAFEATGGFSTIHPGEDPDLSIRLWDLGFETALFKQAYVFHERRISWRLFFKQVKKFGTVRVILNKWHPHTSKLTYWFPTVFLFYFLIALLFTLTGQLFLIGTVLFYLALVGFDSTLKNGVKIGMMSILAVVIQFSGYGLGFINGYLQINFLKREERIAFPSLFFTK